MQKFLIKLVKEIEIEAESLDEAIDEFIWTELDGDFSPYISGEQVTNKEDK